MDKTAIKQRKEILEKKLTQNSNRKWLILWASFVTVVAPFLAPFMIMRRMNGQSFAEVLGYWESVMIFGSFLLLTMPYLIYREYSKMKKTKFDIKRELELLDKDILL